MTEVEIGEGINQFDDFYAGWEARIVLAIVIVEMAPRTDITFRQLLKVIGNAGFDAELRFIPLGE